MKFIKIIFLTGVLILNYKVNSTIVPFHEKVLCEVSLAKITENGHEKIEGSSTQIEYDTFEGDKTYSFDILETINEGECNFHRCLMPQLEKPKYILKLSSEENENVSVSNALEVKLGKANFFDILVLGDIYMEGKSSLESDTTGYTGRAVLSRTGPSSISGPINLKNNNVGTDGVELHKNSTGVFVLTCQFKKELDIDSGRDETPDDFHFFGRQLDSPGSNGVSR